jgi:hypothetical protein
MPNCLFPAPIVWCLCFYVVFGGDGLSIGGMMEWIENKWVSFVYIIFILMPIHWIIFDV